ncbi:hypothetical protein Tco_1552414, partial [Tanacetum coccineum]
EETNIILSYLDDSLPEIETFSFDIEEKNSASTTTHFDNSLPIYKKFSFHDDPTEENNSGSTTTHADTSLPKYDSFHFDLSKSLLHLADKSNSVFEKFTDELVHIITPPEYDCYYFDIKPDPGELTRVVVEDILLETLLPLSSENEDKVFNPRILVSKEEKSPHLLSYRAFKAFKIIHIFLNESPMMIYGVDIPIWDVLHLHFYPP